VKDRKKLHRRMAGLVSSRIPEAGLDQVADWRRRDRRRRWSLVAVLRAVLVALLSGAKSCAECESLTNEMSRASGKLVGIRRRLPDTTLRDILVSLLPDELRKCLRRQARQAHRRGALRPDGLPFGVMAMDGKYTAITAWDEQYSQRQSEGAVGAHGVVRTFTCALVSSRAKVCFDTVPIPSATNEMGYFVEAFDGLLREFGRGDIFALVAADAGSASDTNGRHVRDADRHYLFRLKNTLPTLLTEARAQLSWRTVREAVAESEDVCKPYVYHRRLYLTEEMAGFEWDHLRTVLRIEVEKVHLETGEVVPLKEEDANRYYLSSLPAGELSAAQWLLLVRRYWGVENGPHFTLDKIMDEDNHPWIVNDPQGMVVVLLLRRIAYNLLALFRDVTQRSEDRRGTPWKDLLRWMHNALIALTDADVLGLRVRTVPATGI
jgi:hypothetical protein